jgi:hypothetical protein
VQNNCRPTFERYVLPPSSGMSEPSASRLYRSPVDWVGQPGMRDDRLGIRLMAVGWAVQSRRQSLFHFEGHIQTTDHGVYIPHILVCLICVMRLNQVVLIVFCKHRWRKSGLLLKWLNAIARWNTHCLEMTKHSRFN